MNDIEEMMDFLRNINDSMVLQIVARTYKIMYDALLLEGFSAEQSIAIISGINRMGNW